MSIGPNVGEAGFALPFMDNARIIKSSVRILEARNQFQSIFTRFAIGHVKLIRDHQEEHDKRLLIIRIYLQNIVTDTFGYARLIEKPIALDAFDGVRDRFSL